MLVVRDRCHAGGYEEGRAQRYHGGRGEAAQVVAGSTIRSLSVDPLFVPQYPCPCSLQQALRLPNHESGVPDRDMSGCGSSRSCESFRPPPLFQWWDAVQGRWRASVSLAGAVPGCVQWGLPVLVTVGQGGQSPVSRNGHAPEGPVGMHPA